MPSCFDKRFTTYAKPAIVREFAIDVVLYRGPLHTGPFPARRQNRETVALGQELGFDVKVQQWDFMLPIEFVVIDDQPVQPRPGDVVAVVELDEFEAVSTILSEWEVHPPDSATAAAIATQDSDDWLVHTRLKDG